MGWLNNLGLRRGSNPHQRIGELPDEDGQLLVAQAPPTPPPGSSNFHPLGVGRTSPVAPAPRGPTSAAAPAPSAEEVGGWRLHGVTGTVGIQQGVQQGERQVAERLEKSMSAVEREHLEMAIRASLKDTKGASIQFNTDKPNEELDRALAMAIQEEERRNASKRTEAVTGSAAGFSSAFSSLPAAQPRGKREAREAAEQLKKDEELARRLQQELNQQSDGTPPSASSGGPSSSWGFAFPVGGSHSLPVTPPQGTRSRSSSIKGSTKHNSGSNTPVNSASSCGRCNLPLGYGRYLNCLGRSWHPQCFRCASCDLTISEPQFSVAGKDPFHSECYRRLFQPKCVVCHSYISANAEGLIEYRSHPYWKDKYCPKHEADGTARCCSCERLEPQGTQYVELDDGRKLCLHCMGSVVVDTNDCQPLYLAVLDFYKGMSMTVKQEIPMLCVERQALNAAREGEKKDGHQHHHPETRGLCLSEEQTIRKVVRKPRRNGAGAPLEMETQYQTVRRHCDVTAVLVLYGLPRVLTGSILAHELMHAWIRLDGGFPRLNPEVEEGICQVMAHLWLQSQLPADAKAAKVADANPPSSSSSSSTPSQAQASEDEAPKPSPEHLAEFVMHQIAMDASPVYGGGFRAGHAAVVQFGLAKTISHIRLTGQFPE